MLIHHYTLEDPEDILSLAPICQDLDCFVVCEDDLNSRSIRKGAF